METGTTEKLYFILFNQVTRAIEELEKLEVLTQEIAEALKILKNAQLTTEEI